MEWLPRECLDFNNHFRWCPLYWGYGWISARFWITGYSQSQLFELAKRRQMCIRQTSKSSSRTLVSRRSNIRFEKRYGDLSVAKNICFPVFFCDVQSNILNFWTSISWYCLIKFFFIFDCKVFRQLHGRHTPMQLSAKISSFPSGSWTGDRPEAMKCPNGGRRCENLLLN